mgnify:CR=1 FL=1
MRRAVIPITPLQTVNLEEGSFLGRENSASRGHSLIQRMLYQDEHVEMLVDGLRKAGLEMVA